MLRKGIVDGVARGVAKGAGKGAQWASKVAAVASAGSRDDRWGCARGPIAGQTEAPWLGLRRTFPTSGCARALSSQGSASDAQKPAEEQKATAGDGQPASDNGTDAAKSPEIAALDKKIAELESQIQQKTETNTKLSDENRDLKNRALTALADVENMRVRMNNKSEEDRKFAVRGFAKGMLEVADCLEKALLSMPEEKRSGNPDLQQVYEGVEMTDKIFQKALEGAGIRKFSPLNDKFDPNMHQALFEMPAGEGQEKGVVGAVVKAGYTIHDRVLRPAEVGVTK